MSEGQDKHDERDKGLFSNMKHGVNGCHGYPAQGYPPQGYPPSWGAYSYPPPPGAYPPQYGYPPCGGYPPTGYLGSSIPYQGYGSSHGGGHMGPYLAGGVATTAAADGAHKHSHGAHGGYVGHMGYGGYGGAGHSCGHHHGGHGCSHHHGCHGCSHHGYCGHGYGHHGYVGHGYGRHHCHGLHSKHMHNMFGGGKFKESK